MSGAAPRFRVATFNVLDPTLGFGKSAPWEVRRSLAAETIGLARPEIVGLQESGWTRIGDGITLADDLAALTGLRIAAAHSGDAVLYDPDRWRLGRRGAFRLPRGWGDLRRSAVWQQLSSVESAVRLFVVSTHFSHGSERVRARVRQARAVVRRVRGLNRDRLPVVILGDFNSWPGRGAVTPMDELERAGYVSVAGLIDAESRRAGSLVGMRHPTTVDHIFVSPVLHVEAAHIELEQGDPASDHRMLWADLRRR